MDMCLCFSALVVKLRPNLPGWPSLFILPTNLSMEHAVTHVVGVSNAKTCVCSCDHVSHAFESPEFRFISVCSWPASSFDFLLRGTFGLLYIGVDTPQYNDVMEHEIKRDSI